MTNIEMLQSAMQDINALIIQGLPNWKHAGSAMDKIHSVVMALQKEQETQKKQYDLMIEEERKRREKEKAEAAERGEEIIGGETVKINLQDGTQEVIIP